MMAVSFWIRPYMRAHIEFEELLGFLFFPRAGPRSVPDQTD